jgi:hypothetical protein
MKHDQGIDRIRAALTRRGENFVRVAALTPS